MKLTPKQRAFVDYYVTCRNGAEAARRAGYSKKTARQIANHTLTKGYIQAALKAAEAKLARKMGISKSDVIGELLEVVEIGRAKLDGGVMISACSAIAKMLGFYKQEEKSVALSAENSALQAQFEALSDQELLAVVAGEHRKN